MKNKGFCVIRTKKGNVVNVYSIAPLDFIENNKNRYDYNKSYLCDTFEILENTGGEVYELMKMNEEIVKRNGFSQMDVNKIVDKVCGRNVRNCSRY